ncbi:hypothetical protein OIDMADRAFT_60035 [Oidiodendron maius Zn]|uniref:Uncharacterized protein n=1 Tax=Oidiodendron maius (strain Zn) TaxID=913774 RepID=A0A0C3GX38_OIDMZ|nr:hypothetical protein OIDMADRAFT_60035 [Oidiodendron maius Zn]
MPERRQIPPTSTHSRPTGVRRNLFQQHISRRPTTSSTSTSAETLRLDSDHGSDTADIVIRDKNGDYDIGEPPIPTMDEPGEGAHVEAQEDEKERQRLAEAVKHHQRDRNRAPSEPAELLEAVRQSLRNKVAALSEDNWMYEAEEELVPR